MEQQRGNKPHLCADWVLPQVSTCRILEIYLHQMSAIESSAQTTVIPTKKPCITIDILIHICSFLGARHLLKIGLLSKFFHQLIFEHKTKQGAYLWKHLYEQYFDTQDSDKEWSMDCDGKSLQHMSWLKRFKSKILSENYEHTAPTQQTITVEGKTLEYANNVCSLPYKFVCESAKKISNQQYSPYAFAVSYEDIKNQGINILIIKQTPCLLTKQTFHGIKVDDLIKNYAKYYTDYEKFYRNIMQHKNTRTIEGLNIFTFERVSDTLSAYDHEKCFLVPRISFKDYELIDIVNHSQLVLVPVDDGSATDNQYQDPIYEKDIQQCGSKEGLLIPNNDMGNCLYRDWKSLDNDTEYVAMHVTVMRCMGAEQIISYQLKRD